MSTLATVAPVGVITPPPANVGPRPWRITRDEYYRLGELGFFDGKRVELIRGEVIEMSPIDIAHATGVGLVADALRCSRSATTSTANSRSWCPVPRPARSRNRTSP